MDSAVGDCPYHAWARPSGGALRRLLASRVACSDRCAPRAPPAMARIHKRTRLRTAVGREVGSAGNGLEGLADGPVRRQTCLASEGASRLGGRQIGRSRGSAVFLFGALAKGTTVRETIADTTVRACLGCSEHQLQFIAAQAAVRGITKPAGRRGRAGGGRPRHGEFGLLGGGIDDVSWGRRRPLDRDAHIHICGLRSLWAFAGRTKNSNVKK